MLEVSGEDNVLGSVHSKYSVHTSNSQRMGEKKYNDYHFKAQDLEVIDTE